MYLSTSLTPHLVLSKLRSDLEALPMLQPSSRAQHESIHGSPVLEPVGLVNMRGRHLDPNGFRHRITWPADDYLQATCVYLCIPKHARWPHTPARK